MWRRLTALRPCIVGASRTGSLVATTLAQMGVGTLDLIDPDRVEAHHLDTMDGVTPHDLGHPKVTAVAAHLQALRPDLILTAIPHHITARPALARLKEADVLFCCVDNDAARLATTTLATLYLKPLIDIGTGVFFAQDTPSHSSMDASAAQLRPRHMGSDVRCLLPGEACLLCGGGLVHEAEARRMLRTWSPSHANGGGERWDQQRAGSLRTLNQIAAHLGVHMWLDLVAGRLRTSRWARLEFDPTGHLSVRYPPIDAPSTPSRCVLCARAGQGDAGLGWLAW